MGAPTLTVNGITFTFQDGDTDVVEAVIQSLFQSDAITQTGPAGSFNYDYNGASKTITIRGKLHAASATRTSSGTIKTILEQKQWLESIVNGTQSGVLVTSTYDSSSVESLSGAVSPYQGGFVATLCFVSSMSFTEEQGDPLRLKYQITFVVGQVV